MTLDIAPRYQITLSQKRWVWYALSLSVDHTVLLATHAFIHEWYKPYLSLQFQPKLVLIYRPRRDLRLSWPRNLD